MMVKPRTLLASLFVSILAITGVSGQALAQSDDLEWAIPVNLSHSGAASDPVLVVVPDGTVRVLWWDEFDGLMAADGTVTSLRTPGTVPDEVAEGERWSAPLQIPVLLPTSLIRDGQEQIIPLPIGIMPRIVADAEGQAHAFWLGEPDQETGDQPLLYSRLAPGSTSWSSPTSLAESAGSLGATADISGTVHVAYVQPVQLAGSPTGLYYRQSRSAGSWSTATAIQQSRYFRLLPSQGDSISLTADDSESVYAAWNDPQRGQLLVAYSADGGGTWQEPRPVAPADGAPLRNQVLTLPGQAAPILWEPAARDQSLVSVNRADDVLMLAVWDGARWSETRRLTLHLQDPQLGGSLHLSDLQLALAADSPDQEQARQTLIVVGVDQNQDLWITGIQADALERLFDLPQEPSTAQSGGDRDGASPPAPANLSGSGVASNPAIVAGSDGTLRAFWWDQFDGLMVADGVVLASSVFSGTQEIVTLRESWSRPRPVPLSATTTPRILADATGRFHAFWIQEPPREQQAVAKVTAWPLRQTRLASDATAWLPAVTVAESAVAFDVAADAAGALHLAYVQALDTAYSPSGVYYRRTEQEGTTWTAPVALNQSRYARLLSPETAHVRLAADDAGGVHVTWDDPRFEELLLAYSADSGATWQAPKPVVDSDRQPLQGQLMSIPEGQTLLLWEDARSGGACNLYQAPAASLLSGATASGQRIFEAMATCPDRAEFLPLGEGQVLMMAGGGTDSLTLAAWDGDQWSEPSRVSYSFEDPETGRQVYLGSLRAALVELPAPSSEGDSDHALVAVGTDQEGDVWASSSQTGTLDIVFAPPSPWSAPVSLADSEGSPSLPAMASDAEGRLHVLWSEKPEGTTAGGSLLYARRDEAVTSSGTEVRWTSPTQILPSPGEGADQCFLLALGSQLHAVWRGAQEGEILYSRAFATDAYVASGWKEPQRLPAPAAPGSWPHIVADMGETLHVAYAVPINEERGIYYTRSNDGQNWSEARQVFDAAGAGWAMSDYPRLAVDLVGTIHVVWVRADPFGSGLTQAIYYAQSLDGGETWSDPLEVAEGAYTWPEVIATGAGQVHLLWNEATGENAWWHQWSGDGGLGWTRAERVPGFRNVPGPVGATADGSATVQLAGLGQDAGEPALLYTVWDGQQWGERETFHFDLAMNTPLAGVSAALLPALGQFDVIFRGEEQGAGETMHTKLWHTGRAVPTTVRTLVPTFTPRPTSTPLPTPIPTTTAAPTPSFDNAPPHNSGGSMADLLPLLLPGALAVLIVAGVLGGRLLRAGRR